MICAFLWLVLTSLGSARLAGGSWHTNPSNTPSSCLNIESASQLHNLTYLDGSQHPISIPYASWSSQQVSAHIARIILNEVMNYSTIFYQLDTIDDSIVLAAAVGCMDLSDHVCEDRDMEHPKIHFTLETWGTGIKWQANTLPAAVHATTLSTHEYTGIDGYFLWSDIVESALRSPARLILNYYHAYNASLNKPAAFFDSWQRALELLPPNVVLPCSSTGPPQDPFYSTLYADRARDTAGCSLDPLVWFSPACRANTSECVPLLIQYNMPTAAQLAYFLDMPLAVIYVLAGDNYYQEYYAAVRAGRFLFGLLPNSALVDGNGRLPEQVGAPAGAVTPQYALTRAYALARKQRLNIRFHEINS
jgi:hypothetical protein